MELIPSQLIPSHYVIGFSILDSVACPLAAPRMSVATPSAAGPISPRRRLQHYFRLRHAPRCCFPRRWLKLQTHLVPAPRVAGCSIAGSVTRPIVASSVAGWQIPAQLVPTPRVAGCSILGYATRPVEASRIAGCNSRRSYS